MGMTWRAALAVGALAIGMTPCAGASAAGENVIVNASFGRGLLGWSEQVVARGTAQGYPRMLVVRTPKEPLLKCERAQRGHPYLQMDVAANAKGYVEQSIVVPVSPGRLTFRSWGDLQAAKATVSIVNGPAVHQLVSFAPPLLQAGPSSCSGARPIALSLSMARYAGEAVGLRIQTTSPGSGEAVVDFDDFALEAR